MVSFKALLLKFDKKGEKTGWTYFEIPPYIANELNPGVRTSYRVKGKLDGYSIKLVALLPMGEGGFIIPVNADMRRGIRKKEGASIEVELEIDTDPLPQSNDLLACLEDEPKALAYFNSLPTSHQNYYSKWIESAKTIETKTKRISMMIKGMMMGLNYGETLRYFRDLEK
ncbi:YdeI/OmpD-associated family protein [Runella salmonicolor]|uniref:YdeI/OmpD-associated family protein n=1 Tax=Runella salmonicolor TaxID=2950278 RepID=A0ABT1FP57_9BACT|nr:YdeI/OmpD-associated family protein [Runella salmonicolor]MCP1383550.1 YdeI/OmpD-associated family protein [Runella salmonicolor]